MRFGAAGLGWPPPEGLARVAAALGLKKGTPDYASFHDLASRGRDEIPADVERIDGNVVKWQETKQIKGNMKYTGKVRDGVVVLEGSPILKDGTIVAVEPIEPAGHTATLGQRLRRFSG